MRDDTAQKCSAEASTGQGPKSPKRWDEWFRGSSYNDKKMRLSLPPKSKIEEFVRQKIGGELRAISAQPSHPHTIKISEVDFQVEIDYHPQRRGFSYGFPSYTTPYSLAYNPVANRLNEKADQLAKASGLRGVILCDRGCDLFRDLGYPGPDGFRLDAVIKSVLGRRSEISFVITYAIHQKVNGWGRYEGLQLSVGTFYNPEKAAFPIGPTEFDSLAREISDRLPAPIDTAVNAAHVLRQRRRISKSGP